jgi:FAD/FMN-containing dehydrogenases
MEIDQLLASILPKNRIKSRLIDVAAYAPDAGFYYLRPKAVVQPFSEEEITALFRFSHTHKIPVTFRTAGTSLSGQSVTDGILVDLSKFWNAFKIENEGEQIRVQPGVIGAVANAYLKNIIEKSVPTRPVSIRP